MSPSKVEEQCSSTKGKKFLAPNSYEIATAAFIAGCLCQQGFLRLDVLDLTSAQNYADAIRVIAAGLYHMRQDDRDWPELPFSW